MPDIKIIEHSDCLPSLRYKGGLFKVVGCRPASRMNREETDYCYVDLWRDTGEIFQGPDIKDVGISETHAIEVEYEAETISSMNGWCSPRLVVKNEK